MTPRRAGRACVSATLAVLLALALMAAHRCGSVVGGSVLISNRPQAALGWR